MRKKIYFQLNKEALQFLCVTSQKDGPILSRNHADKACTDDTTFEAIYFQWSDRSGDHYQ